MVHGEGLPDVGGEEAGTDEAPVHGARGEEVAADTAPLGPPGGPQAHQQHADKVDHNHHVVAHLKLRGCISGWRQDYRQDGPLRRRSHRRGSCRHVGPGGPKPLLAVPSPSELLPGGSVTCVLQSCVSAVGASGSKDTHVISTCSCQHASGRVGPAGVLAARVTVGRRGRSTGEHR